MQLRLERTLTLTLECRLPVVGPRARARRPCPTWMSARRAIGIVGRPKGAFKSPCTKEEADKWTPWRRFLVLLGASKSYCTKTHT